jgi:macrolide-specific efflux system membrane fusion protein
MRYVLVAVLIAAAAVGGYYVATQANPPLPALKTVAVSRGVIDVAVDLTGTVTAKRSRGLAFGTPGTVASVRFGEGDAVRADDVIAALDTSAIDSQLKAAQSALTSARSALKAAQDAVKAAPSRSPGASAAPIVPSLPSAAQLDANVDAAQAAVDSAQAAIDGAKLAQDGAVIRAPFDGSLTQVLIHAGDYVAPGPLGSLGYPVEIADRAARDIVAGASEDDVVKLADGQPVTVTFDALSDVKLDGAICDIPTAPTPVQGVPTYPVRICLTSADPAVRLGLTASANVRVARRENALLVPSTTVHVSGDDHVVNVVTASGGVVPTTVQVGESDGTITEILSGVSEGDKVEVPN